MHLRGLCKHAAAVGALVVGDLAREDAVVVGARQVDVDGRDLRQHLLGLPAVALRILDLQLPPPRPCTTLTYTSASSGLGSHLQGL